jgi:hypothetical protein
LALEAMVFIPDPTGFEMTMGILQGFLPSFGFSAALCTVAIEGNGDFRLQGTNHGRDSFEN